MARECPDCGAVLKVANDLTAPVVEAAAVRRSIARPVRQLTTHQTGALTSIATSGRQLDLLVGPVG